MLDGDPARLTRHGTVTITEGRVLVEGFESENASCREVAALGALWAMGELQRQLLLTLERPGGGNIALD